MYEEKIYSGSVKKPFRSTKLAMIESDNKNTEKYPKARLDFMNSSDLDDDDEDNNYADNDDDSKQEKVDADSLDKDLKSA